MAKLMAAVELKRTSEQCCDKVKKLKDHCRKTIDEHTPCPAFCFWLASLLECLESCDTADVPAPCGVAGGDSDPSLLLHA